jgi:hypothetical protein
MMVCKGLPRYFIGRDEYQGYSACMNPVGMHSAKKDSEWLGSITGPHTKKVWTRKYAWLCSKALISFGRTHLFRV